MALSGLNEIKLWREHQILGGLDVLKARCLDHHYPLHTHDTFVIASFKEGAQKHKIAQKSGVAYPGTVMVIPPGEVHTGEGANRREGWAYSAFYPTADSLEQIASNLFRGTRGSLDFGTSFLIEDSELARRLLSASEIALLSTSLTERQEAIYSALGMLITRYGRHSQQSPIEAVIDAPIRKSLDFMNENFHLPLSIGVIAQYSGLSEFHFMRLFKSRMQTTVHQHLKQLRLNSAKMMLAHGESISRVATSVGFYDQSHFTNSFRRIFGVTPKKYANASR